MSYDLSEEFLSFGLGPNSSGADDSDANAGTTRGGARFRPSSFDDEEYVCSPSDWWKLSIKDPIEANDIRFVGPRRKNSWEYGEVQKILEGAQDSNKGFNWQPLLCRDALKHYGNGIANALKREDGLSVFVAFTRSAHPRPEGNPCAVMLSIMVVEMKSDTNAYVQLLCSGVPTIGGRLLAYALTKLKSDNQKLSVSLHPTQKAVGFYEKLGFTSIDGGLVFDFKNGRLPVHIAAINNDEVVLRTLLKEIPTTVDATDKRGRTPLMIASEKSHEAIVRALLEAGADVNKADEKDWTPLSIAAYYGHEVVVRALLAAGANVNRVVFGDKATPLTIAAQNGHEGVVNALLDAGANVNLMTENSGTALVISTQEGHEAVVRALLVAGADVNKAVGKDDWTPLVFAAHYGHEGVVRALLEGGADVNKANKQGMTPLIIAAENGHVAIVRVLLERGVDVNNADAIGATALSLAAENGHEGVVRALLDAGADVNKAENDGSTPLIFASRFGHTAIVKMLLDRGADARQASNDGTNPFFAATNESVASALKERGAVRRSRRLRKKMQDENRVGENA